MNTRTEASVETKTRGRKEGSYPTIRTAEKCDGTPNKYNKLYKPEALERPRQCRTDVVSQLHN